MSQGKRSPELQDRQWQEDSGCVWNPGKPIQGPTGHNGVKAKGYQRHCFTCVVLHNKLRKLRWSSQCTRPSRWHGSHSKCTGRRRTWSRLVLFRTTQLFQELLFNLVLYTVPQKFPTNFTKLSNKFCKKIPIDFKQFCKEFCKKHKSNNSLQ